MPEWNKSIAANHLHTLIPRDNLPNSMFLLGEREPKNPKETYGDAERTCETPYNSGLTQGPWCCKAAVAQEMHYNIILLLHCIILPDIIYQDVALCFRVHVM